MNVSYLDFIKGIKKLIDALSCSWSGHSIAVCSVIVRFAKPRTMVKQKFIPFVQEL